jgi:hypothetical protein
MGDVARNKLGQNNATYVQPFGNMDGAPAGIIFHLVISVITASNSSCLIRKRWHKLLLAIDPLFVCQIPQFLPYGLCGGYFTATTVISGFNQKGKAIGKNCYLQAEGSVHILRQEKKRKAAHEVYSHKHL